MQVVFELSVFRAVMVVVFFGGVLTSHASPASGKDRYVEGEVLVTFKESADLNKAKKILMGRSLKPEKHYEWLSKHTKKQIAFVRDKAKTTAELVAALSGEKDVVVV